MDAPLRQTQHYSPKVIKVAGQPVHRVTKHCVAFADKRRRQGFASGELAVLLVVILPIDHDNCAHAFEILEGAVAGNSWDSWNSANEPYARRHKDPEAGLS